MHINVVSVPMNTHINIDSRGERLETGKNWRPASLVVLGAH